jgi:hypothetical protein
MSLIMQGVLIAGHGRGPGLMWLSTTLQSKVVLVTTDSLHWWMVHACAAVQSNQNRIMGSDRSLSNHSVSSIAILISMGVDDRRGRLDRLRDGQDRTFDKYNLCLGRAPTPQTTSDILGETTTRRL